MNKSHPYTDVELELLAHGNWENWFIINRHVARLLFKERGGVSTSELHKVHTTGGTVIRTLRNAEADGILWSRKSIWFMTVLGRRYFYYVFILSRTWDWEEDVKTPEIKRGKFR